MNIKGIQIVTSIPKLAWLNRMGLGRRVQGKALEQLKALDDLPAAQQFIAKLGLRVRKDVNRLTRTAFAVSLATPPGFPEYFSPQVVISRLECDIVPQGSLVINCLIPEGASRLQGETALAGYRLAAQRVSTGLQAAPFACLTGHKTDRPVEHDLDQRGFRFFFSPRPNTFYARIIKILMAQARLSELHQNLRGVPSGPDRELLLATANEVQELKWVATPAGRVGHSLLEDVKIMAAATTLIDLRDQ